MKRIVKRGLSYLLILTMVLFLTACGGVKLSGTYSAGGLIPQTFTFDGDNITMSAFGVNASGTYKISDDTITITYSLFGMEQSMSQSFSGSGKTIYIGGTEFTKQ